MVKKAKKKAGTKKKKAKKLKFVQGTLKQIGVLTLAQNDDTNGFFLLRQSLRDDFKYVEGKDFSLHFRFANGDNSKLSALAAELLDIPVDLIVTAGTRALKEILALPDLPKNLKMIQAVGGEDPGSSQTRTGFFLDVVNMCQKQVTRLKNKKKITDLTILHDFSSQMKNDNDPYTAVIQAAADLKLNSIGVSFTDLEDKLTAGPIFSSDDDNVVAGFMLIPNGMFFGNATLIGQKVDAAMAARPNTWAIYPEPEFKDGHSVSTKDRVIILGHDVAKAYKNTASHINDHLKGKNFKASKEAELKEDP
jgi:hypothetical protein